MEDALFATVGVEGDRVGTDDDDDTDGTTRELLFVGEIVGNNGDRVGTDDDDNTDGTSSGLVVVGAAEFPTVGRIVG